MSVLYVLKSISVRDKFKFFPINKVPVVLKLAYKHLTLAVALFNLCYMFYIVFVKHIKWCMVPHIIAQMGLPVDGVCINSAKLVCAIGCET